MEAILNSWPFTPVTSDLSDKNALTPGLFLIGDMIIKHPNQNLIDLIDYGHLFRWQRIRQLKMASPIEN